MMQAIYSINHRQYSILTGFEHELFLNENENYLFDLSYLSVLHVLGDNAAQFLQGQLTCDLRDVTETTMRQGALCNLKGRIQALLDVTKTKHYQLILATDLVADTVASLSKVAMLSRVSLKPASYRVYGFYLGNNHALMPANLKLPQEKYALSVNEDNYCYCIEDKFFIILSPLNTLLTLAEPFITAQQFLGSLAWHRLQLKQKHVQIYPDTRGLFLPHRLDLHRNGYISFDKGCYKGQEIIARTHYKAKLKHSLHVFKIHTVEPMHAGKKLMNSSGQAEVGEIIDFCPLTGDDYLIVASVLHEYPEHVIIEGHQNVIKLDHR